MLAVLALFLMLAGVAWFMLNARAVRLITEPAGASVTITNTIMRYAIGERHLMLPGDYVVLATHPGYHDLRVTLQLLSDAEQEVDFNLELTPLPGILTVTAIANATPIPGAVVHIDQKPVGETPLTLDAVAGRHDLYVTHPRYLPYQTEINIEGRQIKQESTALLSPAWANLSVNSRPTGARVLVDGEAAHPDKDATTPATIEILQGPRKLTLKKPGYKVWQTELDILPENDITIPDVILTRSDGRLTINTVPPGVNITISGQYQGQTPLSVALPPGKDYKMLASRAGYEPIRRSLHVKPEEDQSLRFTLTPKVGIIRLEISPPEGRLFVDGKSQGQGTNTLKLPARKHRLRVELAGYATWTAEITPKPGLAQQLNISLQTTEEARVSAIPRRLTTSQGDHLRFVIPGRMTMGAGRREPGRRSNEVQKEVLLTLAFYLGEQEITNKHFKEFSPGHDSGKLGRALLGDDDRPVVNVSWNQAAEFCNWLSQRDGLAPAYHKQNGHWQLKQPHTTGYRLPTEPEWAWAARYAAGEPTRFPWGDIMPPSPGAGNFADAAAANMVSYHIINYNDNFRGPAPPGTFAANEFGIFDLAGNVSEWVNDFYSIENYRETLTDPIGPLSGDYRVIRGSNYTQGRFSELRWTFRDYGADPRPDVGFRIARYVEAGLKPSALPESAQ